MAENLPYILCPELHDFNIKVVPLWLKPKGNGKECPVVKLENVPPTYDSVLTACNFVKLKASPSWIVDVSDKDEIFWRRIFGDIQYIMKKPESVYQPDRLVYAALPSSLSTIIREYTEEHIRLLTKKDQLVGIEAIRLCKRNTLEGSIISRGVWSVIRAAALERISKNPEDVDILEYIKSNGLSHNLDISGFPTEIDSRLLLRKILERKRLTAQMEKVLPQWYRKSGAAPSIIFADWKRRVAFIGSEFGGPVEEIQFIEVELLAEYILDNSCSPLVIEDVEKHKANGRFLPNDEEINDWVSHLEIPRLSVITERDSVSTYDSVIISENVGIVPPNQNCTISMVELWGKLDAVNTLINRRVEYSKIISKLLFSKLIFQSITDPCDKSFIADFEFLISLFSSVTNSDALKRLWSTHSNTFLSLLDRLSSSIKSKMGLSLIFSSCEVLENYVKFNLENKDVVDEYWWEFGFAYSRSVGTHGWKIYKVGSNLNIPLEKHCYETISDARVALRDLVLRSRISLFRTSIKDFSLYVGYKTSNGQILLLSELNKFRSEQDWIENTILNLGKIGYPSILHNRGKPITINRIKDDFNNLSRIFFGTDSLSNFNGRLSLQEFENGPNAYWDDEHLSEIKPGSIAIVWLQSLLRFAGELSSASILIKILDLISTDTAMTDFELGLEDDLIDSVNDMANVLNSEHGNDFSASLIIAIENPSLDNEMFCYTALSELLSLQAPKQQIALVRDVLLFTANYRPYTKMSLPFLETMRLGITSSSLVLYAFIRYLWIRLTWNGSLDPILLSVGEFGDLPQGELFPEADVQWKVFKLIELALLEIMKSERFTSQSPMLQ